ncbi:type II secretion system protein GspL [Robbsia andropogonis]|uniref:type II secretion system protein GspL n=1 Tax=Robbsia andropogonis TaxID=28092 RepID=UPI002A69C9EF|nr:type II secretion system protein GspL [Robbsia andropogonis]
MSTLTVLIPPRDAVDSAEGGAVPGTSGTANGPDASAAGGLRYVLMDRRGALLQSGSAPLHLLPVAQMTCLVLAARDVLLVDAPVPPLHGVRMQQALPNIIEDWLLPDTAPVHLVVGPLPGAGPALAGGTRRRGFAARRPRLAALGKAASVRTVAAVDRNWLRSLLDRFTAAGHKVLRVVPMTGCLPLPTLTDRTSAGAGGTPVEALEGVVDHTGAPVSVLIDIAPGVASTPGAPDDAHDEVVEVTLRRRPSFDGERVDVVDTESNALVTSAASAGLADAAISAESTVDGRDVVLLPDGAGGDEGKAIDGTGLQGHGGAADKLAETAHAQALTEASGRARIDTDNRVDTEAETVDAATAHRLCGEGLRIAVADMATTLDMIAPNRVSYYLASAPDGQSASTLAPALRAGARPFTMEQLALAAQRCPIDLCQFEFAPKGFRLSGETWRQVRWPVLLVAASILVCVIGVNLRWMQLVHQRNAVQAAMTERLLSTFPSTTVVLDPVVQMTRSLDALRVAAGELSPNDFLMLTNGLSLSMGGISPNAIATMKYDNGNLEVIFHGDASVDQGLRERLSRQGLEATTETRPDGQHWTIRSRR